MTFLEMLFPQNVFVFIQLQIFCFANRKILVASFYFLLWAENFLIFVTVLEIKKTISKTT